MSRGLRGWQKALVGLAVLALLGEIGLRVLFPGAPQALWMPDPELGTMLAPSYSTVSRSPEGNVPIQTNALGMRSEEVTPKRPGEFRVLVVGDSWVFGGRVDWAKAFPRLLEQKLNAWGQAREKRFSVYAMGVPGWGTGEELLWLQRHGREIDPDLVVLAFYSGNDVFDNARVDSFEWDGKKVGVRWVQPPEQKPAWEYAVQRNCYLCAWLGDKVKIAAAVLTKAAGGTPAGGEEFETLAKADPPRLSEQWSNAMTWVATFKGLAESLGAKAVVMVIPSELQVSDEKWAKVRAANKLRDEDFDRDKPEKLFEAEARLQRENFGPWDVTLITLVDALRKAGGELYFKVDGHWNETGHAVAAEALFNGLLGNGLIG